MDNLMGKICVIVYSLVWPLMTEYASFPQDRIVSQREQISLKQYIVLVQYGKVIFTILEIPVSSNKLRLNREF
jgi:hypothetical protein